MQILFSLSAAEMNRACCRLGPRLTGRTTTGVDRVAFTIDDQCVEIAANETSAGLAAEVQRKGRVSVPSTVMHGVITTLPYFGHRKIQIGFSEGKMRVDNMVFHHRMIVLTDSFGGPRRQSL